MNDSMVKQHVHGMSTLFLTACLMLSTYVLSMGFIEFVLVDWLFIISEIQQLYKSIYVLLLILVFGYIPLQGFTQYTDKHRFLIGIIIMCFSMMVFYIHKKNHFQVTTTPFMKTIDKKQVIQGDYITLQGRGFGPAWKPGKVELGSLSLRVIQWDNHEVVAEIPVPQSYFTDTIQIITHDNKISNGIEVEVADPSIILNPNN